MCVCVCQLSNENKNWLFRFFWGDYTLPSDVDYIQPLVDKDPRSGLSIGFLCFMVYEIIPI